MRRALVNGRFGPQRSQGRVRILDEHTAIGRHDVALDVVQLLEPLGLRC